MQTIPHLSKEFLDFKLSRQDFQETRSCRRFKEDLFNYELCEKKLLRLKYKESYETGLQETLSPLDLNHACSTTEAKSSKLKDRLSKKLDKKFNVLKRKKGIPQLSIEWFHFSLEGKERSYLPDQFLCMFFRKQGYHVTNFARKTKVPSYKC